MLVRYGDTAVLVTATMSKEPREGIDFFHCWWTMKSVSTSGKIPGLGQKEGRPSEDAILSARMIDRPLRPLFPMGSAMTFMLLHNPVGGQEQLTHNRRYDRSQCSSARFRHSLDGQSAV